VVDEPAEPEIAALSNLLGVLSLTRAEPQPPACRPLRSVRLCVRPEGDVAHGGAAVRPGDEVLAIQD
jgi:hypothetical protein